MSDFDFTKAYKVDGWSGIAWRADEHAEENLADWSDDEPIWERDETRVVCHMIGDDRPFTFGVDELTAINDEDYCSGCGQIGCGWC